MKICSALVIAATLLVGQSSAAALTSSVKLQRRQNGKYPPPNQTAPPAMLPQSWSDALNAAVQQGKIPNIPASTSDAAGNTAYPNGLGNSQSVCSWTTIKCNGPNDLYEAPDNTWVVSFDDGPTGASPDLYNFLEAQNQSATHFMIGSAILTNQDAFKQAASSGQELAVHTWSHQLMTTMTNEQILGELGWTMQIIYDLSGRVPTLWRPPQGDIDNRVRAIAENVFGLQAVMWDAECNDWCLQQDGSSACPGRQPGQSYQSVVNAVHAAMNKPKSPGVILLEHELTPSSVGIFKSIYPSLKPMGWNPMCVSDAFGKDWYDNARDSSDTPVTVSDMAAAKNLVLTGSGTSASATTTSLTVTAASASTRTVTTTTSSAATVLPSAQSNRPSTNAGGASLHGLASFMNALLSVLMFACCMQLM
jgi:peptidoglycan/xylan/chitin deacetylase (PgdA/CDA1 family)